MTRVFPPTDPMHRLFYLTLVLINVSLIASNTACDDGKTPARITKVVTGSGSVTGRISFIGPVPVMATIKNEPCCTGAAPISEETALVDAAGGLANVVISIEGLPATDETQSTPPLLDQKDCRYTPHVIAVAVGQKLTIRSSDATFHNVHYDPKNNPPKNFAMTHAGDELNAKFERPDVFGVRCDVHPWMQGYIAVFDNRFFAISRSDGVFRIGGLPAGTYKLVTWHERFGRKETSVTVADGQNIMADIAYEAPKVMSTQ